MTAAFLSYPLWNASTHFLLGMTTENTMFPTEFGIYPLSFSPGHSELWNTPKSLGVSSLLTSFCEAADI